MLQDPVGRVLFALTLAAFGRVFWIDFRMTAHVRRVFPDVTSRDPRKWAYLRANVADENVWRGEKEQVLLATFIFAVYAFAAFHFGADNQHDRAFGWLALCAAVLSPAFLAKDFCRRRKLLAGP